MILPHNSTLAVSLTLLTSQLALTSQALSTMIAAVINFVYQKVSKQLRTVPTLVAGCSIILFNSPSVALIT